MNDFAKYFDNTLLKPDAAENDFAALCEESAAYGFKMVAINPAAVRLCKKLLDGTGVSVGAAIGFPLGQNTVSVKLFETECALNDGADEIDYVINISELKNRNYSFIKDEMQKIIDTCKKAGAISKVIFENCYLNDEEKRLLCEISLDVRPDFIKTSTGFGSGGATVSDVKLMKSIVGDSIQVKASGGIRDLSDALMMIEAGAGRIGTSASVKILKQYLSKE